MLIKSCVNHYFSLTFLRKTLKKYVDMFLACQKSKVTIKLKFYYSNLKDAVETVKIAVDSCYVLRQFLTPLPSIDFREIRGLVCNYPECASTPGKLKSLPDHGGNQTCDRY